MEMPLASITQTVLVTGGGGFLGRGIVERLVRSGYLVRSLSRKFYQDLEDLGVEQYQSDLADAEGVERACRSCDLVFHVAAKAGIWGNYEDFFSANVLGTRNVLRACRKLGISRLVYTSSPSVVFDGRDMEGVNESVPYATKYLAAYPETKAMAEREVLSENDSELATVALRPHLIWGPGDTHIVPGIVARGRQGQLRRIGKEDKLVDFTYVDNAVDAHLCAARILRRDSAISGKTYFISDGRPVWLWAFIDQILDAAGVPPVQKSISPRLAYLAGQVLESVHRLLRLQGEPRLTRFLAEELSTAHWFDISSAREELGYRPRVGLEEGLEKLSEWLGGADLGPARN